MNMRQFQEILQRAAEAEAERRARIAAERQRRVSEIVSTAGSLREYFRRILPDGAPDHAYTDEFLADDIEWFEDVMAAQERANTCAAERECGIDGCRQTVPYVEWAGFNWIVRERACPRAQELARLAEIERRKGDADVPARFRHCDFDGFSVTPANRRAVEMCRQYAETFESGQSHGLFIAGDVGTGKTHLAVAVLMRVIERGFEGRFVVVPEWLRRLRSTFDGNGSSWSLWETVQNPGLVVLEDVGGEKPSGRVEEQMVMVVDYRDRNGLPTVVTSNLGLDELQERLGARTVSRIIESCDGVLLKGEDYRKRK